MQMGFLTAVLLRASSVVGEQRAYDLDFRESKLWANSRKYDKIREMVHNIPILQNSTEQAKRKASVNSFTAILFVSSSKEK